MKKINRSFTVEYRNGRRKTDRNPTSIWGDLDLKSVARQANEEAFSLPGENRDPAQADQPTGMDRSTVRMLTPTTPQENNAEATKEIRMPDENDTVTETIAPDPVVAPGAPVKQQRRPRAKKAIAAQDRASAAGAAPSEGTDAPDSRQKRGRKAKAVPIASRTSSKPVPRPQSANEAGVVTPLDASDDMAELLRLEDENRSLRRQLSDKLRTENADLRKRLNLA